MQPTKTVFGCALQLLSGSCSPHAAGSLVPALDDATSTKLKCNGIIAVQAAVELGAISQLALYSNSVGSRD